MTDEQQQAVQNIRKALDRTPKHQPILVRWIDVLAVLSLLEEPEHASEP